jgi:hypothetical protein
MSDAHQGTPFGSDGAFQTPFSSEGAADPLALFESEADLAQSGVPPAQAPRAAAADRSDIPDVVAPAGAASQAPGRTPQATIIPQGRIPIAIDDLLNRLGHVEWVEAVAIVEALCVGLTSGSGTRARIPELSNILITAQGTVVTRGGSSNGPPGPRLARTLHELTAGATVAVPLRLFITKWVSFTDEHSVADFAKELAYYSRPDGAVLIRAVYERALAKPSTPPKPRPVAADAVQAKARRPQPRRLRRSRRVAAAVIMFGTALTGVWIWRTSPTTFDQETPFNAWRVISDSARAMRAAAAAASERFGPATRDDGGSAGPAPESRDQATAAAPESTRGPRAAGSVRLPARNASARSAAGQPATPSLPAPGDVGPSSRSGGMAPAVPMGTGLAAEGAAEGTRVNAVRDAAQVFTSADPDVRPPELLRPQLPFPLLSGVRTELNTMELIVSETGTVERVQLISQPRRMADMMLLSGAKAWVFEPASWRGQSVRYRLLVSWDSGP